MGNSVGRYGACKIYWPGRAVRLLFLLAMIAGAGLLTAGPGCAGEISLLAPFESESVLMSRNKIVDLVVKVAEAKDLDALYLQSELTGQALDPTGRYEKDGAYYVHFNVRLKKGANDFILAPGRLPVRIKYLPLSSLLNLDFDKPGLYFFHKSEVIPAECGKCHGQEAVPPGIKAARVGFGQVSAECYSCHSSIVEAPDWKHFPASALLCRSCHRAEPGRAEVPIPSGRVEELCFDCHLGKKRWLAMKHVHGPVGTGDCTICHDPHGSNSQYQLWTDGKAKLCVVCHQDKQKYISKNVDQRLRIHGILSARGCVVCHSPHADEHRFQLSAEINDLCVSCHIDLQDMETGHPVKDHPMQGIPDPLRSGETFSCTSCHNPHGSKYANLLIGDMRGGLVCAKCHTGGRQSKPKRPSWYN